MTDCLSPHVKRVRVVAWTCDCRAVFYELCQARGMAFIRRTLQRDECPEVGETHRMCVAQR